MFILYPVVFRLKYVVMDPFSFEIYLAPFSFDFEFTETLFKWNTYILILFYASQTEFFQSQSYLILSFIKITNFFIFWIVFEKFSINLTILTEFFKVLVLLNTYIQFLISALNFGIFKNSNIITQNLSFIFTYKFIFLSL